ncbi:hypothetical protein [Nonomuraea sp. NPDC050540]|uniref:hypothetical protein n=1 Tax=Nonomuraea sp. NPDC050540 TaxID=3364367 RepID=UPI0037994118
MSIWKRGLALAGTAFTIAAGPALLGSAPAAAAPATAPSSSAAGHWSYNGWYYPDIFGERACHRDGRRSVHPYECRFVAGSVPQWQLWMWINW